MKHAIRNFARLGVLILAVSLPSMAAANGCYADYKAKKDDPLKLHYGVVELKQGCTIASAQAEIEARIGVDGWTLLNVLSLFDAAQLPGKDSSAGKFYLRY